MDSYAAGGQCGTIPARYCDGERSGGAQCTIVRYSFNSAVEQVNEEDELYLPIHHMPHCPPPHCIRATGPGAVCGARMPGMSEGVRLKPRNGFGPVPEGAIACRVG